MITPRATRLVRVRDLQAFREAAIALALDGDPVAARDRLVVVPTRAAAAHLVRSIEETLHPAVSGCILPELITAEELVGRLAGRLATERAVLTDAEREVLLGTACRTAVADGLEPPFRLRPGLIAEILRFYDALRRNQKDVDTFERLALGQLEPGAAYDRGAERLVRQTRFLVAAFREFERRCAEAGDDEHALRRELLTHHAVRPYRHVVLTVGDRAFDANGLAPADWDLLARVPGLERLDVVVTDRVLAGALHERLHRVLPGIEEVRFEPTAPDTSPVLAVPAADALVYSARDREEEVAGFARRVKHLVRRGELPSLDGAALVVRQPLPYVYVGRDVLRAAGIPCQMFDALPLADEPYAAALDLVFSFVASSFARAPAIALLRSPHFRFPAGPLERGYHGADTRPAFHFAGGATADTEHGHPVSAAEIGALDRALSESGYLGEPDALDRLIASWEHRPPSSARIVRALRAARALRDAMRALEPLGAPAPVAVHLDTLLAFLAGHERLPGPDDPLRVRQLRARAAVRATLASLRNAYARFDESPVTFDEVAALVRRWIEGQTFAPRTGDSGVHLVDAASAPFGRFDHVQLAGLIDGEWPDRARRNIFYSTGVLRDLGWSADAERLDGARAAFGDLLRLPLSRLAVSTFLLERDAPVSPSALLDELEAASLARVEEPLSPVRIFEYEALASDPLALEALGEPARAWAAMREAAPPREDARFRGATAATPPRPYSLSALERYQDCPFRFFASDVLRLEEAPEDEDALSPRARGRFVHEVFQQFFERWDAAEGGTITPDRVDAARALFAEIAAPLLARLPDADAALERTRLFGSAISTGIVDTVLALEAARPQEVRERWLEHRFEGEFTLCDPGARPVALHGVADRIDLLSGNRLRVIDYKTGSAPNARRALQVPIYALCAQERLLERDGTAWEVDDAAYIAFSGKRTLVPVVKSGGRDAAEVLADARARLHGVLDGVARGEFPPRPHDAVICRYCAYPAVCRKDYVDDQ